MIINATIAIFSTIWNLISSYSKEEIEDVLKILNSWLLIYSYAISKKFSLENEANVIKDKILKFWKVKDFEILQSGIIKWIKL